jgi:hypothetical protein
MAEVLSPPLLRISEIPAFFVPPNQIVNIPAPVFYLFTIFGCFGRVG